MSSQASQPGSGCHLLRQECTLKRLRPARQVEPYPLFSENSLHLADFLLDLPTYLFDLTFGF